MNPAEVCISLLSVAVPALRYSYEVLLDDFQNGSQDEPYAQALCLKLLAEGSYAVGVYRAIMT